MDFKLRAGMSGMPQIPAQLPTLLLVLGGGAVAFGLLVLFNEWLVRWLVAGVFLVAGAVLLLTGLRAKKLLG